MQPHLLHGVDGDIQCRVVPGHLGVGGLVLLAPVGRPDPNHTQHDHRDQEADADHDDDGDGVAWRTLAEVSGCVGGLSCGQRKERVPITYKATDEAIK